jgi:hypothetical protein
LFIDKSSLFLYDGFGWKRLMTYFAASKMKKGQQSYSFFSRLSAFMMIAALAWLTISAPFVYASQQEIAKQNSSVAIDLPITQTEEEANPLNGSTEEKAPKTVNSVSEEYLHDNHRSEYFFSLTSQFHKGENATTYIAYHGELHVPPPNKA